MQKELEHRCVVRRIADVDRARRIGDIQLGAEELARHRQLVVIAEPAIDVDRAQLGMQSRVAHERADALRRLQRQGRHVFAVIDRKVGLAVGLIGGDGAARHGGGDFLADGDEADAVTRAHFGGLAVLLVQPSLREAEIKRAVFPDDRIDRPHARDVVAPPGGAACDRHGAKASRMEPLERAERGRR